MKPSDLGTFNRDQIILTLRIFGPLRSKELVERLVLSPRTVRAHLRALRAAGKVERVGHAYRVARKVVR